MIIAFATLKLDLANDQKPYVIAMISAGSISEVRVEVIWGSASAAAIGAKNSHAKTNFQPAGFLLAR